MNISRNFLLIGVIWILIGMSIGEYMGATNDHTYIPLHAHINLLGFVLPGIFALTYRAWPAMAQNRLAPVHFWLHTLGTLLLMVLLYLLFAGRLTEESSLVFLAPISAGAVILGTALFGWNVYQNAK